MSIDREVDQAIEAFAKPAEPTLADLVIERLQIREPQAIDNLAEGISTRYGFYESEVRTAILGLLRRNQVEMTDDLLVKLPAKPAVPSIDEPWNQGGLARPLEPDYPTANEYHALEAENVELRSQLAQAEQAVLDWKRDYYTLQQRWLKLLDKAVLGKSDG